MACRPHGSLGSTRTLRSRRRRSAWRCSLDGLDGRIARMTNTVSDFGREMDSLADVITFGIAPAVLAFAWGVQFVDPAGVPSRAYLAMRVISSAFLFLLCGAGRLARFNVQKNPVPKNPGRPDRKYFVGLPIPAAAGWWPRSSSPGSDPLRWWPFSVVGWRCWPARLPDGQYLAIPRVSRT